MTPRLLLLVALALSVPAAARSDAPAPGAEPARPATALGPEVPRGAMARFLAACSDGHYARAAEYVNLRQLPQSVRAQRGAELARELEPVLAERLAEQAGGPLRFAIGLAVFAAGLRFLALAVPVQRFLAGAEKALAIVAVTWLVLRGLDVLMARFERRLDQHRHLRAMATVPLGRRSLKVFVAVVAFIAALQNFGFNVTGLIAGLGVGGLAVALAAQKTVENLFGSVSLVADQPVRLGDVCRFGDTVGTVEDIGLRSTRVRTVDRTLVTIPNAQFSTLALENLSQRDRIPVRATVTLPQGTSAERVRQVLAALREMVVSHPKVHADSARARFVRMGPQAPEIELFAYVLTARSDEFVEIREQIFLGALEVVGAGAALK